MAGNLIMLDRYTTIHSAGRRSGYSKQYIRRLIRNGRLCAIKAGTEWLIEIASLDGYRETAEYSDDKRRGPRRKTNDT
jgi:excisionase family DNA binding protein